MKSLNRTLSLVLVLVMVLGMFGIAGAAFTDSATVQYKEAVDVMSAIGVINGMETGAFNPKGNLTREQAAKIVCYLTMGKTAADNLKTSVAPFKDVNADRWSAGSIAYCVQQGIISGRGDGTFDPAANVTGYEFAKMLLVALGYDATIEQFTGPSWNINVAKRAYANGLFDGNDVNGSVAANREEAALYALNLIQAKLVTYANKGSNIIVNGTVINTTASEPSQKDNATFMKTYHPKLDVTPDYDVFGSDANRWTLNGKEIGRYATRTALTFTAEAEGATVAAQVASMGLKNHTIKVDADKNSTVYPMINGVKQAAINNVTEIPALTANGRVVKIYTDKDNSTIITGITVIDTELAQITKINAATKTVSVKTMAGATITIDSDNPNYATLSAMAVKDYVLVTPVMVSGIKTIATVAIPKTVTGTLTKISTDKAGDTTAVTVGGNSYDLSFKEEDVGGLTGSAMSSKKEITLYLDSFGYAIYVTNATVATPYIGVVKISQALVNNVIINMVTGYAPDGSVVTLNIGSETANKNGTLYSYAPATSAEAQANNSEYTLTPVSLAEDKAGMIEGTYVTNNAAIKVGDPTLVGKAGNDDTDAIPYAANVKFIFISTNGIVVKDGVQAVKDAGVARALITKSASGIPVISAVYVAGEPVDATGSSVLYLAKQTGVEYKDGVPYYSYVAMIDGVPTPIITKGDNTANLGFFCTYAKDDKGVYAIAKHTTSSDIVNSVRVNEVVGSTVAGYLFNSTNLVNKNAKDAVIVDLTTNNISTLSDIADLQKAGKRVTASVIFNDSETNAKYNTVSYIYIVKVDASDDASLTAVTDTTTGSKIVFTVNTDKTITAKDNDVDVADLAAKSIAKGNIKFTTAAGAEAVATYAGENLADGDTVVVTAADGVTEVTYTFKNKT